MNRSAVLGRLRLEQRRDVAAIRERADEGVTGGIAMLEDTAAGSRTKIGDRLRRAGEFVDGGNLQPVPAEQVEGEGAVVLEPVAKRASADDVEPLAAKLVLQGAEPDRFEDQHAIAPGFADPIEFGAPIVDARE